MVENIPVTAARSTPDGFAVGDRVAYLSEQTFRLSQEIAPGRYPPNDFLVRSVMINSGLCGVYLVDADGNQAGLEETVNLLKLEGQFRVLSVLDDVLESGALPEFASDRGREGDGLDVVNVHEYVRAHHGENDRISFAKYDDLQLDRLIAVWVSIRRSKQS